MKKAGEPDHHPYWLVPYWVGLLVFVTFAAGFVCGVLFQALRTFAAQLPD